MEARMSLETMITIFLVLTAATTPVAPAITTATTPEPTTILTVTTTPYPTTTEDPTTTVETTTPEATAATPTTVTTNPTTAATTVTTTATTIAISKKVVIFRSLQDTFTSDLLNSSSEAFKKRATMIENQLGPFFRAQFESFAFLNVTSFSNGSIINTFEATFQSTSAPGNDQIRDVLVTAASNITGFDIELSSIVVDGTSSAGVGLQSSLVAASFTVLLSWLLSSDL